ncbi:hypothetical protein MADA3029_620015 [Vibrio nigripulchritudo MADA3029]|nr:hypothetical protein VIBNIMADA3020_1020014 [Vibrio nigripulchritudo MADA3020]CCN53069.1 hypothetical protein VIBNIMADA3021_180015 [Vibrio nigripulchritudo MADA3021]CCN60661.1 hypothetical protein MADA3029_620015 [Vibrio nigripulchritudo MADA3029]
MLERCHVTHCKRLDIKEKRKTKDSILESERDNCQTKTHAQKAS